MTLKRIVYVSAGRRGLSEREYARILDSARRNNARNDVTGLLLCIDDGFFQILEGAPAAVDETYARICNDPRHTSIRTLHDGPADTRSFKDWTMGFQDWREKTLTTEGAVAVTRAALMDTLPPGLSPDIKILIRTFCVVNAAA